MFNAITKAAKTLFSYDVTGYDAINPKAKRRNSGYEVKSSDVLMDDQDRRKMMESGRDLWRNFSAASWAIRKHLDYVASFNFHPKTGDARLDADLETLMEMWSRRGNCEIMGKHSFRQFVRLLETRRIIDGDVFVIKLQDGRVQGLESDRIRNPWAPILDMGNGFKKVHGITINSMSQPLAYSLWNKTPQYQYNYDRELRAENVYHLGYFDSFDQIRGVSPLAAAIAPFHDILEVTEYARLKAKVSQLFALTISRDSPDFAEDYDAPGYDLKNFGKGPIMLDLDPGDKAEFLESKTPSTEFQDFMKMSLDVALKALDLDWSMFDSSHTNYSGSRIALLQYRKSCVAKQEGLKDMLYHITNWKIQQWISTGVLRLPRGWRLPRVKYEWIPDGIPWFDPSKELRADIDAINAGLKTHAEIRRERYGDDWYQVAEALAKEQQYKEELGLTSSAAPSVSAPVPSAPVMDDEEDSDDAGE